MSARVLIPVDNQDCCMDALQSVMSRHWDRDTEFLLCQVVESVGTGPTDHYNEHNLVLAAEQENHSYQTRLWLSDTAKMFAEKLPNVETRMEKGDVTKVLCDLAYDWNADYIIVGSHDLSLNNRCALGSVASALLKYGPCSLESVRSNEHAISPRKVIVATDLSAVSEATMRWVEDMSWNAKTEFRIVTVTSPTHKDLKSHLSNVGSIYTKERQHLGKIEETLKRQARQLAKKCGFDSVEADILSDASPADAVCDLAQRWGADLVVTGASGANRNPDGRAGDTAIGILDRLHCSMIAIQSDSLKQVNFSWS